MDSSTDAQAVEETASEVVEVVLETEAEAGASGYSVTGGGERGLFIKDVLKDSTAAKHLSLQQGDQLLSARVYFDNVKYEDALKILQCAEPYKVSFFLKRTIAGADVTMHPGTTSLELKGPKTKMQKMSVKSIKPFKAKKKKGGRFGLKRLKENKKGSTGAELEMEGSPSKVELNPIDVEFAFPKFKLGKDGKAEGAEQHGGVVTTGRKKRTITCSRMKANGAEAATGEVDITEPAGQADVSLPDVPGAKVKVKGKGHRFGIHFPKTKKTKSDTALSGGSLDLKPPGVKFTPPSVEFSLPSGNKDVDLQKREVKVKEGSKLMHREVELSLGLPSACHSDEIDGEIKEKGLAEGVEGSTGLPSIKMPVIDIFAPNIDLQLDTRRTVPDEIEGPFFKGPNISMPKTDIALPKIGSSNMDIEGPEKGGKICLPIVDISLPKMIPAEANVDVEGHIGKGGKFKTPTFDVSLPKFKSPAEHTNIEGPEVKGEFNMPKVDLLCPKGKAEGKVDIEGYLGKGGQFQMPTFDISLPKMKSSERERNVEGPEVKGGKMKMPSIDISLPEGKTEGNINIEGHSGKGGKFKMTSCDISPPKMKGDASLEGPELKGGKFEMPSLDISLAKGKTEGEVNIDANVGKEGKFSLPKIRLPKGDMKIEGSDVKGITFPMPTIDCSLPAGTTEGDMSVEGDASNGGKSHMPSFDISAPRVKLPDGKAKVEGPEIKGGKVEMPKMDVSLPKGKTAGEVNIEGHVSKGGRFKMPTFGISFPKLKSPEGKVNTEGPEVKGGKFKMPTIGISLPKGKSEGDINVEGGSEAGGKFHMPTCDISPPKMKSPDADTSLEGPEVKGGKCHMPTIDLSLPKGKGAIDTEGHSGKGGKFQMPAFDISLPKMKTPDGEVSLEVPEVKGGNINMPTMNISLPKGKMEGEAKGHASKGGKLHMPSIDISLPKMKLPEGEVKVEGPEAKGGNIEMPSTDISLPKGKMEGEIDIEGHSGKGGRFHMPTFDVSLPKMKSLEPDVSLAGPDTKGGKFHMPTMDFSLPKEKGEIDTQGHSGKGGKFQMPALDISHPKMKTPEGEVSLEGPDVKGGKFKMPKIDISLPKGKTEGGIDIEGHLGGKGKFHMPTCDMSLPKMKSNDGDMKLEGPEVKGSKIHMPKIDNSLPKGKAECDIQVDGHGGKGGKFQMPSIDISLPKMKLLEGEVKVEGPEAKDGKFEIPTNYISLQKGNAEGEIDMEGHSGKGGKFHMPKFDVSLPKMKIPEGDIKLEGPEGKGNKIQLPNIDISLPKGKTEGDIEVEGHGGKGGKFHMPSIDISLPKMKLPEGEVKVEGPEAKGGNIEMPPIDISLPKGKMEGGIDIEVHSGKGGRFHMPTVDVSLPKMKSLEPDVSLEGPDVKGGKFEMPKIDILLPKGKTEGETDIEEHSGNGGKFHMTSFDVSLPKMKHPVGDVKEGLEVKGGKFKMPKIEAEVRSGVKLPTVKLPKVDVSAPKVDFDSGLSKSEGDDREETELQKAEGERPSSGSSSDMPDISLKMPRFSLPKFGGKSSGDVSLEGYGTEDDIDISPPRADGEGRPASAEIRGEGKIEGKLKKPKMKMPMFGISKKDVSKASPDVEIKTEKGKVDIPKPGISVEHPEDKANRKYRLKFPKFKKSSPKGKLPEGEIDVSMDSGMEGKGGIHAPDDTNKMPKFSMPGFGSQEIDFDSSGPSAELDVTGKVQIPSVEISLPAAKKYEQEVLLPKAEVDVSEADIRGYEGNLKIPKMPTIDVSALKIDLDVTLPKIKHETKIEGDGGKFKMPNIKMPDIDLSLPKEKTGNIDASKVEIEGRGGKFKMPVIKMPKVDISLPIGRHRAMDVSTVDIEGEGVKFKMPHMEMPNVDISLTKGKSGGIEGPEMEIEGGGGNVKMPHMKMPVVDLSHPKGKSGDKSAPEIEMEGEGGTFKMPHIKMPNIDLSLPKGKSGEIEGPEVEIEGEGGKSKMPHMKMPNIDVSIPKGKSGEVEGPEVEIEGEGGKFKMPHMKMPNIHISLLKGKTGDVNVTESEIEGDGGKSKMPHMKMPNVDISLSRGKTGEIEAPEMEIQSEGGKFKMPKVDISLPKGKYGEIRAPEMEVKGGNFKMPHMKMPNIAISLPKGKSGDVNAPELEMDGEGGRYKMPEIKLSNIDITMPKGNSGDIDAEIKQPNAEAEGNIKMPLIGLPTFTTPDLDLDMNVGNPNHGAEVHGKSSDKTGSHSEGDHKTKIKMPTIDIECPKEDMELDIGFHKAEGKKDRKIIELPDLDLKTSGTKGKGPKVKSTKFKIGLPKMKNTGDQALDATTKKTGKENEGASGRFMIKKTKLGKGADVAADAKAVGSVLPNISFPDVGFSVSKGASQEDEGHGPEMSAKLPKFKLPNVEISGPSMIGQGGAQINSGQQENKDGIKFQMPKVTLPSVGLKSKQGSAEPTGTDAGTENGFTLPNLGIKVLKIPDIDFDIGASQAEDQGAETSTRQKIKIPKFGVALPAMSSPEARVHLKDPEVEYEGPKMPKVKKAVFVLVNPQTDHSTMSTMCEASVESGEAKIRMPKIKMKPSFGKSGSKEKSVALSIEGDVDRDDKSKGAKQKIPKVTFSPGKTGSFDVTLKGEGSSSSLNGEKVSTFQNGSKEDKAKFVKLKLPKIEFSSPYSKIGRGEEDLEMSAKLVKESSGTDGETKRKKVKSGKMSFPGFKKKTSKGEEETQDSVVSSSARTEMLDQDSSESTTAMVSIGFVPGKSRGQAEAESNKKEMEGKQSTWFKSPKFNLKPNSTGILLITPEGSPQGSRSSLQCQGVDETAGNFRLQMPSTGFSTQEVSEENVTTTKEGTVTVVTKTTKNTVTESRTGQTHTSLSHCNH
uniref:neuroblast differentiation-associated protein AHNAK isoform X1 n=1 Tax=Oncorhynchus gorbuscha TaxID=8017 RepID=UPI001EAF3F24|nr:neuroblast differentiation-associated protein AHNAK isoform X1 [Oncorhynchus gorbuscha]